MVYKVLLLLRARRVLLRARSYKGTFYAAFFLCILRAIGQLSAWGRAGQSQTAALFLPLFAEKAGQRPSCPSQPLKEK